MHIAICEVIEKFMSIWCSVWGLWALGNLLTGKHYYTVNVVLLNIQECKSFCFFPEQEVKFVFGFVFLITVLKFNLWMCLNFFVHIMIIIKKKKKAHDLRFIPIFLPAMREKLPNIEEGRKTKLWNKSNLFLIVIVDFFRVFFRYFSKIDILEVGIVIDHSHKF